MAPTYLQRDQLERGVVYEIRSRNLIVGVYDGDEGFIGIREKFGDEFLFTEYLSRECGGTQIPFDTVTPVSVVADIDSDIPLMCYLGTLCDTCGQPAEFERDPQVQDRVRGWWNCDGDCPAGKAQPRAVMNQLLFDVLQAMERPVQERIAKEFAAEFPRPSV